MSNAQNQGETPQHPTEGGSYSRDPETGALTLVHRTEHEPAPADKPEETTHAASEQE
jgi:hypothetical protein